VNPQSEIRNPNTMFHYDGGLFLTLAQLGVDVRRRQPRCFVSHAHADHIARHELAFATTATARLYQHRLGPRHRVREMAYREPVEFGGLRLTAYPAGHCLGSAMLLAEDGERSLLYTGDFKLGPSATSEEAELPRADVLIMESTFGRPHYRLPPRADVIAELIDLVMGTLAEGRTPVIHAYPLGKSQEVTKLLTDRDVSVLQHPVIYAVSQVYEACGVDLGDYGKFDGRPLGGHAVVTMPRGCKDWRLPGLGRTVSIAVTGWAAEGWAKYRLNVDYALPLSDHADHDQLIETVRRVQPREIFCTHGPAEFAEHLCDLGFNAYPLHPPAQRRLFC
jgi:Cft2 family RNA processing exonuclease